MVAVVAGASFLFGLRDIAGGGSLRRRRRRSCHRGETRRADGVIVVPTVVRVITREHHDFVCRTDGLDGPACAQLWSGDGPPSRLTTYE